MNEQYNKIYIKKHIQYILKQINTDLKNYAYRDSNWISYWSLSSIKILLSGKTKIKNNIRIIEKVQKSILKIEKKVLEIKNSMIDIENPSTFHICDLYAIVCTLYELNKLEIINKMKVYEIMISLKREDGTFSVCEGGESDLRSIYSAIAIGHILNLDTKNLKNIILGCKEYLLKCQSYEGGFGPIPGGEAQGGYTYCAISSLSLLNSLDNCDMKNLKIWLLCRNQNIDGGLNGRTNKESDACYSYWIGASIKILIDKGYINKEEFEFKQNKKFVLKDCQSKKGGFKGKGYNDVDILHTCYSIFFLTLYDKYNFFSVKLNPTLGITI